MVATWSGDVAAVSSNGLNVRLERVLLLPQLSENLLSISKMADRGLTTVFTADGVVITRQKIQLTRSDVVFWGHRKSNLYEVAVHKRGCIQAESSPVESHACVAADVPVEPIKISRKEFHERLNHLNHGDIDWLEQNGKLGDVSLVSITNTPKEDLECEPCILGKHRAGSHQPRNNRASSFGEEIHLDSSGRQVVSTPEGYHYFCIATDSYSNYSWVKLLRRKSDAYPWIDWLQKQINNRTG